jgi:hypothetical protein
LKIWPIAEHPIAASGRDLDGVETAADLRLLNQARAVSNAVTAGACVWHQPANLLGNTATIGRAREIFP